MYDKLLIATLLFVLGQAIGWFGAHSQFVWEWAKNNTFLIVILTAIPSTLCFVYGLRFAYDFFQSGWAPRFYIFALSFLVFPFLFSYFMNESFFTLKNFISMLLSVAIVYVQIKMK